MLRTSVVPAAMLLFTMMLAVAVSAEDTMLLDFETPDAASAWSMVKLPEYAKTDEPAVKAGISPEHATNGKQALKLTFYGGEWPAIGTTRLALPENPFGPYRSLKLDVIAERRCLVGIRVLQEQSKDGVGYSPGVSRYNAARVLAPGRNELTLPWLSGNEWRAITPKLGRITTFIVAVYQPNEGQTLYVDNVRLAEEPPPESRPIMFKVLGTDLEVSGLDELAKKYEADFKKPEPLTIEGVEKAFTAKYEELKKTHPGAALAVFRQGQKGFDPRDPEKVYEGWADTHINSHSPDGPNPARTSNKGENENLETFMRHRTQLIRIDVSNIPEGSKVLAAQFLIVDTRPDPNDKKWTEGDRSLDKPHMWVAEACNRPWVETEAHAYEYAKGKLWNRTGGMQWTGHDPDFLPVYLAHGVAQGPVSVWDFTEAVRFWTDGAHANHGFMLHGNARPYLRSWSKECQDIANRPALMVIYEEK